MKTLDDLRKRIKQEQERFDQETIRRREAFEEVKEERERSDRATGQEIRKTFVEQTESREQSFHQ